jgi:hypothetical protein
MNLVKKLSLACSMLLAMTIPALAGTTISSPVNGSSVSSPFNLTMYADTCSSRPVIVVGYSLDNSPNTPAFAGQTMNGPVTSGTGWHTVHVKVWNDWGQVCVSDVSINVGGVAGGGGGGTSIVPSNAVSVGDIQTLGDWTAIHDGGTPGSSSGWMGLTGSPSISGNARVFATSFWNFGGERYAAHIGDDQTAQNFLYDAYVYIGGSADGLANLEFDLNQTMPNGETVIMGFQCDGWTGTWDYTVNGGSPQSPRDTWLHSYAGCNPHSWGVNQWHHVQISYSHNESGWVTYKSVWLDGKEQDLYITAFSGFALGWGPSLLTNFQVDGSSSGSTSATVYIDKMTIYRW